MLTGYFLQSGKSTLALQAVFLGTWVLLAIHAIHLYRLKVKVLLKIGISRMH